VLQVHDLVDFVSEEAELAGAAAAAYAKNGRQKKDYIPVVNGGRVSYVVPQKLNRLQTEPVKLFFRPDNVYRNVTAEVADGSGRVLASKKRIAAAPGEMETLIIKPSDFAASEGGLTVSIREDKQGA
jgi:sarcosine oxidase subunit alpha